MGARDGETSMAAGAHGVSADQAGQGVAVAIPCFNEALTIGRVVLEFRRALPAAAVYVFDNASSDESAALAAAAGAQVIAEPRRGKGHVVRAMFQRLDADVLLMVDGDDTYPAEAAPLLIAPILRAEADMVVGARLLPGTRSQFAPGRLLGNRAFAALARALLRAPVTDLLSGYRAFSRRFVQEIGVEARGFEIETELTIRALQRRMRVQEVPVTLRERPPGSRSKLRAVRDGTRILRTMLALAARGRR
jgi:glycosyltransferase involved in cell wall biosynthesis